jgi:hypothetical protein
MSGRTVCQLLEAGSCSTGFLDGQLRAPHVRFRIGCSQTEYLRPMREVGTNIENGCIVIDLSMMCAAEKPMTAVSTRLEAERAGV